MAVSSVVPTARPTRPATADRIRDYRPSDERAVVALLVDAFHDDPGYVHTFPERRREALEFIMPPLVRLRHQVGRVRVLERDGDVVGSLSTSPSSVRFGVLDYVRQGLPRMPFRFGWATTTRMLQVDGEIGQLKNRIQPRVHHAYLAQLACHPDHQGTGVGAALVQAFLGDVDAAGEPASLVTTRSDNVLFYERFGFAIGGQCGIQQSFTAWCMVREASP